LKGVFVGKLACIVILVGLCLSPQTLWAADEPESNPQDPVHDELRALRTNLVEAYNANDMDRLLSYCAPQVAVTWQNGETSIGREAIRAYYEKMMKGSKPVVAKLTADPTVDALSVIYGGTTAVAWGKMNDHYDLTDGKQFDFDSRFSATAVKEGDRWLIASFHVSPNAFDNGLLRLMMHYAMLWSAGIAAVVGVVVGFVAAKLLTKARKAQA
jgi:uncharacterized protein (TIGR02246 family)